MPLQEFSDFSLFPFAGYAWNLFLLESYVRRFSDAFRFDVRAANSSNVGVILRKSFHYGDYDDILALAVARSSVTLTDEKEVSDYLFDKGYIGRRNLEKGESNVISKARSLREEGAV
jgi:hypothetical protein